MPLSKTKANEDKGKNSFIHFFALIISRYGFVKIPVLVLLRHQQVYPYYYEIPVTFIIIGY